MTAPLRDRTFPAIVLVFLALAAALLARTASVVLGAAIAPAPGLPFERVASAAPAAPPVLDAGRFGHLFGLATPSPDAPLADVMPSSTVVCFTCEPVRTGLHLQLLATMVANERRWSMALLADLDRRSAGVLFIDDHLQNAWVYDILREPHRVIIVNEDTHRLEYVDALAAPVLVSAVVRVDPGAAALPMEGVRRISDGEVKLTRDKLDAVLANLSALAGDARIVPSWKDGVATGFRLVDVRPGSFYSALGIQSGDVISRVNGFELTSPDKALELYARLKEARSIEVEVERRGAMVKTRYGIE
jgi:general secretion pathway protein C